MVIPPSICLKNDSIYRFICDLLPYLYPSNYPKEDAPKLVIIFLGVNDSCYEEIWPLQHVPVETYGKNLESVYSVSVLFRIDIQSYEEY